MAKRHREAGLCLACCLLGSTAALALPTPDHIVIVIEENEAPAAILGSPSAPFINSLAAGGASFSSFYSITHPSQPNYLQLYSGANQGVAGDFEITTAPFSTPNLGAELLAAGKSFAGYFEDLPAAGSTVQSSGKYSRRHNPVVNWQSNNPGPNQYGPALNLPFSAFPTDFNQLPTVSFVVPNVVNDMHDAPVAVGDAWLGQNLGAYAQWAQTHNSLLIVTWDEDDFLGRNRIVNIFSGPMVKPSQPEVTWTHHNLLRTIEDMYGTSHAGAAAQVRPIVGPFVGDPELLTTSYRDRVGPYQSASDTYIDPSAATTNRGNDATLLVREGSAQGLLRFDSIFGNGAGQTPPGAKIVSAKLLIPTADYAWNNPGNISVHRMLADWTESSTWQSMAGGVSIDDVEAVSAPEFGIFPNVIGAPAIFDVSDSIALWSADPAQNKGWLFRTSSNLLSWNWRSSETLDPALRPTLEITYERPHWNRDADGSWSTSSNWISGVPTGAGAAANFLRNITAPRSVQLPATLTVGSMTFDSDFAYTLNGAALTIASMPDVPSSINVIAGAHTINAAVTVQNDTPVNVAPGARLDVTGKLTINLNQSIAKTGGGVLRISGGVAGAGASAVNVNEGKLQTAYLRSVYLQVHANGSVAIIPAGTNAGASKVNAMNLDRSSGQWQGQFDLTNNSLIVQADAATRVAVLNQVADQIATARNSGLSIWTGQGITSSFAADSDGIMGVAVLSNDNGAGGVRYATFAGLAADINSILVKYTLVGDMDLDGDVDADDYSRIDVGNAQHLSGYWNGDLDYSGRINADDFFAIDRAFSSSFNQGGAAPFAPSSAVPEPAAIGFGAILAVLTSWRFRRRTRQHTILPSAGSR